MSYRVTRYRCASDFQVGDRVRILRMFIGEEGRQAELAEEMMTPEGGSIWKLPDDMDQQPAWVDAYGVEENGNLWFIFPEDLEHA